MDKDMNKDGQGHGHERVCKYNLSLENFVLAHYLGISNLTMEENNLWFLLIICRMTDKRETAQTGIFRIKT